MALGARSFTDGCGGAILVYCGGGDDLPLDDQWNSEGAWMYPRVLDGTFNVHELFAPHNEHRIVWTHLLNLALFKMNGQWVHYCRRWQTSFFVRRLRGT
jgi:hypothetical protein